MAKTSEDRSHWLKHNQNEQKIQIKSNDDTLFTKGRKKYKVFFTVIVLQYILGKSPTFAAFVQYWETYERLKSVQALCTPLPPNQAE